MPIIDEVGEGSLPAKEKACMVVFCLMRTGRAIDCNLFRPGLLGGVNWRKTARGKAKGRASSEGCRRAKNQVTRSSSGAP